MSKHIGKHKHKTVNTSITLEPKVANSSQILAHRVGLSRSGLASLLLEDFCRNYDRRKEELGLKEVELYENDK